MLQNALNIKIIIIEAGGGEKENTWRQSVPGSIATESYVTMHPRH